MTPNRPSEPAEGELRLQVFLARAGLASRRASEDLIRAGRVTVNGRSAELGMKVDPRSDTIRVDREVIGLRPTQWVLLNKPRGYVTTREDPGGRKTVYDLLPPDLHHLFHVGRLDRDSTGALLLTNDGKTANRLTHPRYGTRKRYRVDVEGEPSETALTRLLEGVELEDGRAHALSVELRDQVRPGIWRLVLVLEEGRNREVRRMMEAIGHPVDRLLRESFAGIGVEGLRPGKWRYLDAREVARLQRPGSRKRG
ncbi:MAG TPA: pseudouridine synthase [Longimicrobiaceae bacterium]|nr:pseudouridine synthase [Longimicrobiaceae bacterium]